MPDYPGTTTLLKDNEGEAMREKSKLVVEETAGIAFIRTFLHWIEPESSVFRQYIYVAIDDDPRNEEYTDSVYYLDLSQSEEDLHKLMLQKRSKRKTEESKEEYTHKLSSQMDSNGKVEESKKCDGILDNLSGSVRWVEFFKGMKYIKPNRDANQESNHGTNQRTKLGGNLALIWALMACCYGEHDLDQIAHVMNQRGKSELSFNPPKDGNNLYSHPENSSTLTL